MGRIFQPLLFVLARCTRNQLIRQIEFLKAENEMLRKRIPRRAIVLKPEERDRLIRLGQAMGVCVKPFITIVTYETYNFWMRKLGTRPPERKWDGPALPKPFANWSSRWPAKLAGATRESWASCESWATRRSRVRRSSIFSRRPASTPMRDDAQVPGSSEQAP